MTEMISMLARLGSEPIAPDIPCGASARYEPENDRLGAEIAKLDTLTPQGTAEPVDWGRVVDLGCVILREKSKDLLVASYLSRGLFERQGYAGLEAALTIYCDLLETFWEGLFPEKKRMRGRIAAISWMAERLGSAVAQHEPTASEHKALVQCRELIDRLERLLEEKLEWGEREARDFLSPLSRPLRERCARIMPPAPPPAFPDTALPETPGISEKLPQAEEVAAPPASPDANTPAAPPAAQGEATQEKSTPPSPPQGVTPAAPEAPREATPAMPAAAASSTPVPTTFESESDVQKALRDCQATLRNAAAFWLGKDLANPLPYRLVRIGTWMLVSQLPQSQNQITQISRPQPEVVRGYEDALQQGHHARLIPEVESHFARAPFWLDAHYMTAMALDALGPTYAEAKRTVVVEMASFVRRLPEVLDLKFADGTPFANEQTRAWIDRESLGQMRSVGAVWEVSSQRRSEVETVASHLDGAQPMPWLQAMEEATQLAAAGKVIAGAALFRDRMRQATSQRERFIWRLQQARFCLEAGALEVAIPQLEFLQELGGRFALDEWEPALSLDVVQLLLQCYYTYMQKTKKPTTEMLEKAECLYANLCRLDVTAALVMNEKV